MNVNPRHPVIPTVRLLNPYRQTACLTPLHGAPRRAGIPGDCLEGLAQYTHCWLLYIFHENTDLGRLWKGGKEADRGLKAKVAVPRLNGGRMGVLATRSPHRPCPIGAVPRSVALSVRCCSFRTGACAVRPY